MNQALLLLVLVEDPLDPLDLGVFRVPVEREAVTGVFHAHMSGDSSESVDGEFLIAVVGF